MENHLYSYVFPLQFYTFNSYKDQNTYMTCSSCLNLKKQIVSQKKTYEQLSFKLSQTQLKNEELLKQTQDLRVRLAFLQDQTTKKRSARRKKYSQKQKVSKCPYSECEKLYASEVALNLHLKLKHKGGTKRQRQFLAKKIILAQKKNLPDPISNIVLPPNYLETFKQELLSNLNQDDPESDFLCSEQNQ